MRLALEHPRIAGAVAVGMIVLLPASLVARATAGGTASLTPGGRMQMARLRRENARLGSETKRQGAALAIARRQALALADQVRALRAQLEHAHQERDQGRRGYKARQSQSSAGRAHRPDVQSI